MSRNYKVIVGLLVLLVMMLTYLEANEPRELNWNPSYSAVDKIPLGAHVLFKSLQNQDLEIKKVKMPPFEFLDDTTNQGTYFFLNDRLSIDDNELKKMLAWVERGNTLFLIAEDFSQNILDTLQLKVKITTPGIAMASKPKLNLSNSRLERDSAFIFKKDIYNLVFDHFDSINPDILGTSHLYQDSLHVKDRYVNFLRDSIGKGAVYLHSTPKAFSNYFLLDEDNYEYAERALAYIPSQKVLFWDQYYKSGKSFNTSPLFIVLNNTALKWAYYFIILGSILFVLFEGKRKQRSIPVIAPLKNQTFHFARTVAGMYLERNDYKSIASKKITLFLDYIRSHWRIPTNEINGDFFLMLESRTGRSQKELKEFWTFMKNLQEQDKVSKQELLQLNRTINVLKQGKNGKSRQR